MKFNLLDIIVVLFVLSWMVAPLLTGIISSKVKRMFAIFLGLFLLVFYSQSSDVLGFVGNYIDGEYTIKIVSGIGCFIVAFIVVSVLIGLLNGLINIIPIPFFANIFAAFLSFVSASLFVILALFLFRNSVAQTQMWNKSMVKQILISLDEKFAIQQELESIKPKFELPKSK